jgi:carboxypeptidase Taq
VSSKSTTVHPRFDELLVRLGAISDLERAGALLVWDEETKMPPLGAAARAEQRATIARVAHELATAPALGELLDELRELEADSDPDSFEACVLRVARRDYERERRVPPDLKAELTRAASHGYAAWLRARAAEDFELLRPQLERRLALTADFVACHAPYDDPYDVLLAEHEPGLRTADVAKVFARLKDELVPLVAGLGEPVDDSCLRGGFPPEQQRVFALELLGCWGMEPQAWRLDDTVHPFEVSLSPSDIRLTARFDGESLNGVLSCLHEFGHGLYERQVDERYARTPFASGASSAFHESQSRLWENVVGRRLSTWRYFYPRLQQTFPRLADVSLAEFHRALNRIAPGPVRVDADEVTYSLHVVLRFELERELLAGDLAPADLPAAFEGKLREYLGVGPANVVEGVLQDVHWSDSSFGYFPTYALGNVISMQLWAQAVSELGDLDAEFERGEFGTLRDWLRRHVHRWGRTFEPADLLRHVAGGPLDPEPYLAYLRGKVEESRGASPAL